MLQKFYDVLQIRAAQSSIRYRFYLEISSLYSDFIPDSFNIPANNSYDEILWLMLDLIL